MSQPAATTAPRDQTSASLLRRLIREHLRPLAGPVSLALVCMMVAAAATAANAWLMEPVLDKVFVEQDRGMLLIVPLAVLAATLLKGGATYGEAVLMNLVGQRIIADTQKRLYATLIRADLAFFQRTSTGRLISSFANDAEILRSALGKTLVGVGKNFLTVLFLVALMFYQDWQLAAIAFVVFPMAILPIARIGRRLRRVSTNTQEQFGHLTSMLDETFQGARMVKAYGMERYETRRADRLIEGIFRLVNKAGRVRAVSHPIMESLGGIAIAIVIFYGGSQVIAGETTPGTFFSFITALLLAYQPFKSLAHLNANLQEGLAAAQRLFAMMDVRPEIRDAADARPLAIAGGEVRLDQVSFAYDTEIPALRDVSLVAPAGSRVALVGASGAGKSTLLNLIPRFYEVEAGRVLIDGQDVRSVTLDSLRASIALVSQEIMLFDDTVRANIAYGRPDATDAEIAAAARSAAAHGFIQRLPEGYQTLVGEHGTKLSGGQRQRIAIARAMLRNAPILLLDEATSALDTESERQVQRALTSLMQGRTTLVIAHSLSTVQTADIIYVLEAGRVVERGSHAELLARGGAYARLYAMQFAEDAAPSREVDAAGNAGAQGNGTAGGPDAEDPGTDGGGGADTGGEVEPQDSLPARARA